jgi:hypothetical protein
VKSYDTPTEAMRETLRYGNIPVLRGATVRKEKLDVTQIALDLGCTISVENDRYEFHPGN